MALWLSHSMIKIPYRNSLQKSALKLMKMSKLLLQVNIFSFPHSLHSWIIITMNFYSPVSNTRFHSMRHKWEYLARIKIQVDSRWIWERAYGGNAIFKRCDFNDLSLELNIGKEDEFRIKREWIPDSGTDDRESRFAKWWPDIWNSRTSESEDLTSIFFQD